MYLTRGERLRETQSELNCMRFQSNTMLQCNESYVRAYFLICDERLQIGDHWSEKTREKGKMLSGEYGRHKSAARALLVILQGTLQSKIPQQFN